MFSYIGGKSKIGKWIKEFIPYDTETYVEGFSGAFWVFFCLDIEKYTNLKTVVYNDYNKLNANLFACVRQYEDFYEYLKDTPRQMKGVIPTPFFILYLWLYNTDPFFDNSSKQQFNILICCFW